MKQIELHCLLQESILTSEPLINPHLQTPPQGSLVDRAAIYAHGFYSRLEETLLNSYETLAALMTGSQFSRLSEQYAKCYPSRSYSLDHFGAHFCEFLMQRKKSYLAEIAAFEWAEYEAMVAKDLETLTVDTLKSLTPDQWPSMKLNLHPSVALIHLKWNSLSMLEAVRSQKIRQRPRLLKKPKFVLVWRRGLEVHYSTLDQPQTLLFQSIRSEKTFEEICELFSELLCQDEIAPYLVRQLNSWLQEEVFIPKMKQPIRMDRSGVEN